MEAGLFTLQHQNSYLTLTNPKTSETVIENEINKMVAGLLSVFATLGTVPIIRASKKPGAAQMIADRLDAQFRDHLSNGGTSKFEREGGLPNRTLLCVVDRSMDLAGPLAHTWAYQSMVYDVLNVSINRITLPPKVDILVLQRLCFHVVLMAVTARQEKAINASLMSMQRTFSGHKMQDLPFRRWRKTLTWN